MNDNNVVQQPALNIPKRELIIRENKFILPRRTRAGSPNANGWTYTKKAFTEAMGRYCKNRGGKLYLAPACIDSGYNKEDIAKINTEVYGKFHIPGVCQLKYIIGEVIEWNDYTIVFKYTPTPISSEMMHMVQEGSSVNIRYNASLVPGVPIDKMDIYCLDVACIPFETLGVDIQSIIKS